MSAGRNVNSKSKNWGTPKKYIELVKCMFGGVIELDPCSNNYSIVNAKTEFILPQTDGLFEEWNYKTIFINPPYGSDRERGTTIKNWFKKAYDTYIKYNSEIIMLVPVATNTSHWKEYVYNKAKCICFLGDTRLKFLENGEDVGKGAPMSCAIIYYGDDVVKFNTVFYNSGFVCNV